jgi:hypothetical protein
MRARPGLAIPICEHFEMAVSRLAYESTEAGRLNVRWLQVN